MRAAYPHADGFATNPTDGVRVFYEVFGPENAEHTVLFLPTWTMVHSRIWKAQVPYFSRSGFRVVTFDNRGNGKSDRPDVGYTAGRDRGRCAGRDGCDGRCPDRACRLFGRGPVGG